MNLVQIGAEKGEAAGSRQTAQATSFSSFQFRGRINGLSPSPVGNQMTEMSRVILRLLYIHFEIRNVSPFQCICYLQRTRVCVFSLRLDCQCLNSNDPFSPFPGFSLFLSLSNRARTVSWTLVKRVLRSCLPMHDRNTLLASRGRGRAIKDRPRGTPPCIFAPGGEETCGRGLAGRGLLYLNGLGRQAARQLSAAKLQIETFYAGNERGRPGGRGEGTGPPPVRLRLRP